MKKIYTVFLLLASFVLLPSFASAHQPRIVTDNPTVVISPEVSKAYYDTLLDKPAVYTIKADETFPLYVGLLVPDIDGQNKDISAIIFKDGKEITTLDGVNFDWKQFFEPFGHDYYWQGPEYKTQAESGLYEIHVSSVNNNIKYSLAIGEAEVFDFKETMNALTLIPELKKDFFNKSPVSFILSPFGFGLILIMFTASFLFGFSYRFLLKKFAKNTTRGLPKNMGSSDRMLRFITALLLFVWAITTTWNPWLLFCSGFVLFEGLFSWCGFYAVLGKNTCSV